MHAHRLRSPLAAALLLASLAAVADVGALEKAKPQSVEVSTVVRTGAGIFYDHVWSCG